MRGDVNALTVDSIKVLAPPPPPQKKNLPHFELCGLASLSECSVSINAAWIINDAWINTAKGV